MAVLMQFCPVLLAHEQGNPASIVIELKDENGAIVTLAAVELLQLPNGQTKNLTTGADGRLSLDLP